MSSPDSIAHRPIMNIVAAAEARSSSPEGGSGDDVVAAIEKSLYRDNSRVTPDEVEAELRSKRKALRKEPTFPMKLHGLLSDPDGEDVITWLPHGRAWKILSQERFEAELLPRHFDHGNLSSFMRQVNGWDFKRIPNGADENAYYHELFLRGMPFLCEKMSRLKKSAKRDGALCSAKSLLITPDFYRISQDHPLPDETDRFASASPAPQSSTQDSANTSNPSQGTTHALPLQDHSTNNAPGNDQPGAQYSARAAEALQAYILQDYAAEAQRNMTNLQMFEQRLQARNNLLNNLRNIANQSSHPLAAPSPAALNPMPVSNDIIATNIALLLEITRGNQQR